MNPSSTADIYETALSRVAGSLLPAERRAEARHAVRLFRSAENAHGLHEYMESYKAEDEAHIEREHGELLRAAGHAFLTDVGYAIAIAKPAGQLVARRREKQSRSASAQSDSDALEALTPPRVRTCPDNHPHGRTSTCYTGHSCRCDDCRASNSARKKAYLPAQGATRTSPPKERAEWTPEPLADDDPRHGSRNAYANFGCRCQPCTEASRVYVAEKRKNPTGTRNKISEHGTRCATGARVQHSSTLAGVSATGRAPSRRG